MESRFNEKPIVMIDMDGVLSDFERKVSELLGVPMRTAPKGKVWGKIGYYDKNVEPFFESLPKMPDADVLWDFVIKNFTQYNILTATGTMPRNVVEQKHRWMANHYGSDVIVKTVQSSKEKAKYANPGTILIDDRMASIEPWRKAGGIGVLHTSAADSIAQLREIIS